MAEDERNQPQVLMTPTQQREAMAILIARIETALETIHAALAEIKQLQNKAG